MQTLKRIKCLRAFIEDKGLTWNDNKEFVRSLCNRIEQSQTYTDYMSAPTDDYEEDREVWRKALQAGSLKTTMTLTHCWRIRASIGMMTRKSLTPSC